MRPEELEGRTVGHYRIIRPLGYGGTATVFLAEDINLKREVAVKIFQPHEGGTKDFLRRFAREARVLAQLDHPNILPVYDYGEENGMAYLVMPLMAGGSLRDRLRPNGTISPQEAVRLMGQILNALQYAHDRGLIHRDIKPGNMLFKADGTLVLSDFGLVKVLTPDGETTLMGDSSSVAGHTIAGTPDYMAPEQIMGQVVPASDIYGVGVALYEMLTGAHLFTADNYMGMLMRHLHEQPRPLRMLNPNISPALEAVIMRSLEKEPDKRYNSPLDFLQALNQALLATPSGEPLATSTEATVATDWSSSSPSKNPASTPFSMHPGNTQPVVPTAPIMPASSNPASSSAGTGSATPAQPAASGGIVLRSQQASTPYTPSGITQSGAQQRISPQGPPVSQFGNPGTYPVPAPQKRRSTALIVSLVLVILVLLASLGVAIAYPGLLGLGKGIGQTPTPTGQTPSPSGGTVTKGGTVGATVTTAPMGQTTTACPPAGGARAAIMSPLALGNHQNLVYIVNEGTFDNPTFGTVKRHDVTADLNGNPQKGIEISKMAGTYISEAQLSQDGQWVMFTAKVAGQYQLRLVRVDGQGLQTLYCAPANSPIYNTQWSFNQQKAIFDVGPNAPTAYLLDITTGNVEPIVLPETTQGYAPRTWLDNNYVYMVKITPNSDAPPQGIYLLDSRKGPNQHGSNLTQISSRLQGCASFDTNYDSTQLLIDSCNDNAGAGPGLGAPAGPSTITVQSPTGSNPKTLYSSDTQAITLVRTISKTTVLFYVSNYSGDTTQSGLWKINTDGSNPVHLASDAMHTQSLCPYTQYAWSNVSRDGTLYALQSYDDKTSIYGMSYGSLSGGAPVQFASISGTQLYLAGWTSI